MPSSTFKEGTYLGFDFGMKRIGVAVGQTVSLSATPLTILNAHNGSPDWQQILAIIDEWRAIGLVVGVPLNMDGSTQSLTKRANTFISLLGEKSSLPVFTIDERLTTVEAKSYIASTRGNRHNLSKEAVDNYSAKLILEAWFRSINY